MSVYKSCDIRGPVAELSADLYRKWGRSLGSRTPLAALFLVGGDVRESTACYKRSLIDGLCEAGVVVVDLGTLPTPMVYFAKRHLRALGCAIVTASHSPPEINGLKWMVGKLPPSEEEVQQLRREVERDGFESRARGLIERLDIRPVYLEWLRKRWSGGIRGGRVIVDPGNGCWAGLARNYLERTYPDVEFTAIHDRVDGLFRERNPDSSRPQHLRELVETVTEQGAMMGIAFDGDGDRVAFVDGEGKVLTAEETAWILIRSFDAKWRNRTFVYDIKCSRRIAEEVAELGGKSLMQRSGHAFIRTSMIEEKGLFGAEISGHFFYGELGGGDDGLFTVCRMLDFVGRSGQSLAALRRECPAIFTTSDLRLEVELDRQEEALERVKVEFEELPQSYGDGVRVEFGRGWALVRRSVTAPELTFRFEGEDAGGLERLIGEFTGRLGELGKRLCEKYRQEKAGGA